jgi:hypothetical protein
MKAQNPSKPAALLFLIMMSWANNSVAGQILKPTLFTVPPKRWLVCARNSQCVATSLSCHGWVAINHAHEPEVQRWYSRKNAEILSVVECAGPRTPQPDAICHRRVCKLAESPL